MSETKPAVARIAYCNLCTKRPFGVPWDEVGIALMAQHMLIEHQVRTDALDWKKEE